MQNKYKIKKVAIIGGTHGNELTGVYLVKKWLKDAKKLQRNTLTTDIFYANEPATKIMKRYVDQDLNRSFALKDLSNNTLTNTENIIARNLDKKIGPKGTTKTNFDFIIDLHSTTSNMGITLIMADNDPLSLSIAKFAQDKNQKIKIVTIFEDRLEQPYITSITPHAITVEVGAISHGTLSADLFIQTQNLVFDILDIIDTYNIDNKLAKSVNVYDFYDSIDYPKNTSGEIESIIHPKIQDKDYCKIKKGSPLFLSLKDENITPYDKEIDVYPIFVNEAAYYEKGIAMMLTKKKTIKIPSALS